LKLHNSKVESNQISGASIAMARYVSIGSRLSTAQEIMSSTDRVKIRKTAEVAIILKAITECPFNQLDKESV
jgi:hypothetical protein